MVNMRKIPVVISVFPVRSFVPVSRRKPAGRCSIDSAAHQNLNFFLPAAL